MTSHTPSEILQSRADAAQPDMGLRTWASDNIRKNDVTTSKNFFGDSELKELNRLTTILLDIFEDQAELGRLVVMDDARRLLDRQLQSLGGPSWRMAAACRPATPSATPSASTRFTTHDEMLNATPKPTGRSPS